MNSNEGRNYQILNTIATGGTAVLYKAIQTSLDRPVVIKRLHSHLTSDPNFTRRFEIEAKAAASLDHENIVRIIDFGSSNNNYFIVMEYIDGISLKKLIQQKGRLGEELTLLIAHEICMGLDHAHQRGIIHRDIKPANIMITRDGHVKITDFGLAKLHENQTQQTVASTLLGTPLYMSPEQAIGDTIDNRSDLFSLGTICYEMITGTQPFKGENYASVIQNIINGHVPSPSKICKEISSRAEFIIMKALSKEPSKRYRTAMEMAREIESYLGQEKIISVKDRLRRIMNGEDAVEDETPLAAPQGKSKVARSISAFTTVSLAAAIVFTLLFYPERVEKVKSRISAVMKPDPQAASGHYSAAMQDNPFSRISSTGNISAEVEMRPLPPELQNDSIVGAPGSVNGDTAATDSLPGQTGGNEELVQSAANPVSTDATGSEEDKKTKEESSRPVPANGLIEIRVDPPADIIIDGRTRTFSSSLGPLELPRGAHEVVCRRDGYKEYRETVHIKKGELSRRNIILQRITGRLQFKTINGARVFIDGEFKGTTPLSSPLVVPAGKHEVELKKPGYQTWSSIVYIPENEELTLPISLVPM